MKRFTFIIPNSSWFGRRYWHHFPYTEGLLAALLKEHGYEVDVIDANISDFSEAELRRAVEERKPEIVGIGMMSLEYRMSAHRAFEIVKSINPKTVTIFGGVYPTLSPEIVEKDENIDFVVTGEGEYILPFLLKNLDPYGKFIGSRVVEVSLDSLPLPDYSKFEMPKYMNYQQKLCHNWRYKQLPVGITMTSRGCPFECTFCASKKLYSQKLRTMSPERVLAEVDMLINDYGAKEIFFMDDNFLYPKSRMFAIMGGLRERRRKHGIVWKAANVPIQGLDMEILSAMKKSGCYQITLSIESGCQTTLERMKKKVKLSDVENILQRIKRFEFDDVSSNFIIGIPGETWDDIRQSFECAEGFFDKGLLDYAFFHVATPFPGTELYEECRNKGYLPADFGFENQNYYGFGKGVITTPEFTPEELHIMRAFEWDRLNFKTPERKQVIARMMGVTLDEIEEWRKDTRREVGLHVGTVDRRE